MSRPGSRRHHRAAARDRAAPVPDDTNAVAFGVFLVGPGRIELRTPQLTIEN